jgi:hypothetical protein
MDIFLPIFRALEMGHVKYLTIGGLATVLHGHPRLTSDIDLIVQLDEQNCTRAIQRLIELKFRPRAPVDPLAFANKSTREEWINTKGLTVFSMYSTVGFPIEINLFVREPFDFSELWEKRMDTIVDGVTIHVIDKKSLIALKTLSGRSKDIEDITALRLLHDEGNKNE